MFVLEQVSVRFLYIYIALEKNQSAHPELLILHVRQVHELRVLLVLQSLLVGVAPSVLPHVVQLQQQRKDDPHRHGRNDRDLRGDVLRFVLGPEGQRTQDVAQTEGHE